MPLTRLKTKKKLEYRTRTKPVAQETKNTSVESQIAIDHIIATTRSGQPPRDQDVQALINSWGGYVTTDHVSLVSFGVAVDPIRWSWNDRELAACEGIDEDEITDAMRIQFARENFARQCKTDALGIGTGFEGVEVTSSGGQSALLVFAVRHYGYEIQFRKALRLRDPVLWRLSGFGNTE
jgi:hypothetical protein